MAQKHVEISVHQLVQTALQQGDIRRGGSLKALLRGGQAHRRAQITRTDTEVYLSTDFVFEELTLTVSGRADAVAGDTVEEMKSTNQPAEFLGTNPYHWMQALVYGVILARRDDLPQVGLRLTYLYEDGQELSFDRRLDRRELEGQFHALAMAWVNRYLPMMRAKEQRMDSLRLLQFPFPQIRDGQRDMIDSVSDVLQKGQNLFVQAPTGTGKTMGALFPALKAMGEGKVDKVFYLTAKATTRAVAEETLEKLRQAGAQVTSVTLTAKEKLCFSRAPHCKGRLCPNGRGYQSRIGNALKELEGYTAVTRSVIEQVARKYQVCPFELSLDASEAADVIIGDYSHAFDPRVRLKRYFDQGGSYALLVDEAHNLVDRAREMYSASLYTRQLAQVKAAVGLPAPQTQDFLDTLQELIEWFKFTRRQAKSDDQQVTVTGRVPSELEPMLRRLQEVMEPMLPVWGEVEPFLILYFSVRRMLSTMDGYGPEYCTYQVHETEERGVTLFCMDPARRMRQVLDKVQAAVFFSATLSPANYYQDMLGDSDAPYLELPTPFPRENFLPMILPIATTYSTRGETLDQVAEALARFVDSYPGHYLLFFPSYAYLRSIAPLFSQMSDARVLCQKPGMTDGERKAFLDAFSKEDGQPLAGFTVLGGVFGEGIDLAGDRLTGVAVVGTGLPGLDLTNELLRVHFDESREAGYAYAYIFPGFNKVQQAVGRLIRTDEDYGAALLIDARLAQEPYPELYPESWQPLPILADPEEMEDKLYDFWQQKPENGDMW